MIIEFKKEAWQKINLYIKHADGEISGLGVSTLNEKGNFIKATSSISCGYKRQRENITRGGD
mgnify:CR=1 FL=1